MDPNNTLSFQYPTDQQLQRQQQLQIWKDRIYRFFYNIWPSVNRVITFFFYHFMRIMKGFMRSALESIKGGG